jgi:hypothetical protein
MPFTQVVPTGFGRFMLLRGLRASSLVRRPSRTVITVKEGGGLSVRVRHVPPRVHARRSAAIRNEVQPSGTYFFLFVIVNFAPETPRLQPEPVPESASETSPFVSA